MSNPTDDEIEQLFLRKFGQSIFDGPSVDQRATAFALIRHGEHAQAVPIDTCNLSAKEGAGVYIALCAAEIIVAQCRRIKELEYELEKLKGA